MSRGFNSVSAVYVRDGNDLKPHSAIPNWKFDVMDRVTELVGDVDVFVSVNSYWQKQDTEPVATTSEGTEIFAPSRRKPHLQSINSVYTDLDCYQVMLWGH